MKTLLIGATGFLGSHVAARLAERDLAVFVRPTSDRSCLPPHVETRVGDLDNLASIARALERVDALIYCASMGFGHVPPLVQMLKAAGVRRAVFISSTAIFTTLPTRSRAARLEAERAVQESSLAWTILRPTMVYGGARDRNISRLLRFLRWAPVYPLFGDGRALHQPIYVEDLAGAVVAALDSPSTIGRTYNVAGAAPLSYADLVRTARRAIGREVRLVPVPLGLALAAARITSALRVPAPLTPEQVLRLAEDKAFDCTEAVRDFGFRTRTFAECVALEAVALGLAGEKLGSQGDCEPLLHPQ